MICKFGKVMIYVQNPREVADFWINKIGFTEIKVNKAETGIISVEIAHNTMSDASIVLFDRGFVEKMSPEIQLCTPSILFSTYDITEMRDRLIDGGVKVGDIVKVGNSVTFNFSDTEGNYFAVEEIERK